MRQRYLLTFVILLASHCGPAVSPLTGDWSYTSTTGTAGATSTRVLHLGMDGTASYQFVGGGTCSGTITYAGFHWLDVANPSGSGRALQISTEATCTGAIQCTSGAPSDCNTIMVATIGTCPYTITADGNSLSIVDCFGATNTTDTFTRVASR